MAREQWLTALCVVALACGDDGSADPETSGIVTTTQGATAGSSDSGGPVDTTDDGGSTSPAPDSTGSSDGGGDPCLFCTAPNQQCIDDECITTCQGQDPDPCGPAQVCDVITGECHDPAAACTLAGESTPCGDNLCGPGTVCDGVSVCIPVAPCADVACLSDGSCWGTVCSCERAIECSPPDEVALNGPFAVEIGDLEFADDCTAWMVTLRSGTDYVRRLQPDGTLTEWPGVANLNMGEVKVLKSVTPPAGIGAGRPTALRADAAPGAAPATADGLATPPAAGVEGLGEVAITYTCCSTCGCFVDPPQGVARLEQDDPANPLPLVIESTITQGTGPFGNTAADAGPFGLTWGIDRVLYVGNSTANGELVSADLDTQSQTVLGSLSGRITAGAPISAAHLLFAIEGGEVYRFNVITQTPELVVDLGADVTSLSHDAFDGTVYVGLSTFEVLALDPWTGQSTPFDVMPGRGRVTVSPDGQLWFSPVAILDPNPIAPWPLPNAF